MPQIINKPETIPKLIGIYGGIFLSKAVVNIPPPPESNNNNSQKVVTLPIPSQKSSELGISFPLPVYLAGSIPRSCA